MFGTGNIFWYFILFLIFTECIDRTDIGRVFKYWPTTSQKSPLLTIAYLDLLHSLYVSVEAIFPRYLVGSREVIDFLIFSETT